MSLTRIAKKLQWMDQLIPAGWRLPLRYRVQSSLGELEPEIDLLPQLLRSSRGRTALDIGANLGIYTYALSRLGMRVHAFEPQPACCVTIEAWARGRHSIQVHNVGVGETPAELVLHIPLVNGVPVPTRASFQQQGPEQVELKVPVITIDGSGLDDIAFIKIDVEGFEFQVLQGGTGMLTRMKPILLVEIDRERHDPQSFGQIIQLLSGLGYRSHVHEQGKLVDCGADPWNVPARHYNFIFIAGNDAGQ